MRFYRLNNRYAHNSEAGFTLLEVTVAAAILSVILLMLSGAFVNLVKMERTSISLRDTVQSTRYGLDDITNEARSSSSFATPASDPNAAGYSQLCLYESGTMVQYFTDPTSATSHHYGLYKAYRSLGTLCSELAYDSAVNPVPVLSSGVRISAFRVWPPSGIAIPFLTVRLCTTTVTDSTSLQGPSDTSPGNCQGDLPYCAVSIIETSISLRGIQ